MKQLKKDYRDKLWAALEQEIRCRASKKDKTFILSGKWKKFVRKQNGYKIYAVDGKWIRDNLSVYFGHGGHSLVHEFIPNNEIWISTHHYQEGKSEISRCSCKIKNKPKKVSKNFFDSTVIHEIKEHEEMKRGKNYWRAHQIALEKEREVGLITDYLII